MAIIEQKQEIIRTISVRCATTVADSVRINPLSDHWTNNLAAGRMHDAHVRNMNIGNAGMPLSDRIKMEMCTKYGRLWQV